MQSVVTTREDTPQGTQDGGERTLPVPGGGGTPPPAAMPRGPTGRLQQERSVASAPGPSVGQPRPGFAPFPSPVPLPCPPSPSRWTGRSTRTTTASPGHPEGSALAVSRPSSCPVLETSGGPSYRETRPSSVRWPRRAPGPSHRSSAFPSVATDRDGRACVRACTRHSCAPFVRRGAILSIRQLQRTPTARAQNPS